jgi:hypothetical protein
MENTGNSEPIEKYDAEAPFVGGIKLDLGRIKDKHGGKIITNGISGGKIEIKVDSKNVKIKSLDDDSGAYFQAELKENIGGEKMIEFVARTKELESSERHLDFHAKELADAIIKYFGKENNIDGLEFRWLEYSDEFEKYREKQKQLLGKSVKYTISEDEVRKQASMETWLGKKVALPHGFDKVRVEETMEEDGGEKFPVVKGYFYKSPSQN